MIEAIRDFGQSGATLLIGLAVGAAWIITIVSPNTSYDHLTGKQADSHVRELLKAGSDPIAVILLVAGALAILGGAMVAGIASLLAAVGFFTNRWTLASFKGASKKEDGPQKTQRILAVSLTLIFTLLAAAAGVMAVLGY